MNALHLADIHVAISIPDGCELETSAGAVNASTEHPSKLSSEMTVAFLNKFH